MPLTPCQQIALDKIKKNHNIFLSGIAGTGKSYLVRQVIKGLDRKAFPVLASTGAAAVIIGGRTFHSFFGLGIMEGGFEGTVQKASQDKRLKGRLRKMEGLVLDEVSMIPSPAFEAAEKICRLVLKDNRPWGGKRLICVGDFAQLPPISANSRTKDWAFLSHAWQQTEFENILLKTIVRTREKEFIDVLNEIRIARPTSLARDFLNSKTEPFVEDYDGTCLFPRRQQTDGFNIKKLAQIDSAPRIFPTKYEGRKEAIESLKKQAPIPPVLELKIGALVMLRQNDPAYRFINGTTGHVIDIETDRISIELKNKRVIEVEPSEFSLLDADGEVAASAFNFPLCLAYALTIHKAQGTTLDEALIDLRNLWEPGQAYVALSRLSSSDGLKLIGWDESSILADEQVTRFYENIER